MNEAFCCHIVIFRNVDSFVGGLLTSTVNGNSRHILLVHIIFILGWATSHLNIWNLDFNLFNWGRSFFKCPFGSFPESPVEFIHADNKSILAYGLCFSFNFFFFTIMVPKEEMGISLRKVYHLNGTQYLNTGLPISRNFSKFCIFEKITKF